jgi:hypothetical protein
MSARRDLEREYQASDQYLADALQWVTDYGHEHATVVAVACAAFTDSPQYVAIIEDLAECAYCGTGDRPACQECWEQICYGE